MRLASLLRRWLRRALRGWQVRQLVGAITDQQGRRPSEVSLLTSDNSALVAAATIAGQEVVIKIARSVRAEQALSRHARVLDELGQSQGAAVIGPLLPRVLHSGGRDGITYLIETRLPGSPLSQVGLPAMTPPAVTTEVARVVDSLHRATSTGVAVDAAFLARTLDEPIGVIAALPGSARHATALAALRTTLTDALRGPSLTACWVHGDCWLGNVLAVRQSGSARISGLIDWEDAQPQGLPEVDLAHLWLSAHGGDLGRQVLSALADSGMGFERWLADNAISRPNRRLSASVVLALVWLGHVSAGIRHTPPAGPGRAWRRRTVDLVVPTLPTLLRPQREESRAT